MKYSKVATEVASDSSDDETIEFNDIDMNAKEFNPFSRFTRSISS